MKSNENVKVCKTDDVVDVQETDDAVVKKITTKTRTTKSVVKTTTTTTTKKGTFEVHLKCVFYACTFFFLNLLSPFVIIKKKHVLFVLIGVKFLK